MGSSALPDSYYLLSQSEGAKEMRVPDMSAVIPVLTGVVTPKTVSGTGRNLRAKTCL